MMVKAHNLFILPFKALGSICELKVYLDSHLQAEQLLKDVVLLVDSYQKKYSRYDKNSLTSIINSRAGTGAFTDVDDETMHLLNYADVLNEQSDGLFDITSGVLRKAWDFKSGSLPSSSVLKPLLGKVGWSNVVRNKNSVYLALDGMEIDFGGFVKEYIADVVANYCRSQGVQNGLVNLGGDMHIIGPHVNGKPWIVGITHPRENQKCITSVELYDGAIATSGDYERFMIYDGVRYCHILNPLTGMSVMPKLCSVSVVADSCLIAGSFATSAMLKSEVDPQWIKESSLPYLTATPDLLINRHII